jgi:hypothetical protein
MAKRRKVTEWDGGDGENRTPDPTGFTELVTLALRAIPALQHARCGTRCGRPVVETLEDVNLFLCCRMFLIRKRGDREQITLALVGELRRILVAIQALELVLARLVCWVDEETDRVLVQLASSGSWAGHRALKRYFERAGRPDLAGEVDALVTDDWASVFRLLLHLAGPKE